MYKSTSDVSKVPQRYITNHYRVDELVIESYRMHGMKSVVNLNWGFNEVATTFKTTSTAAARLKLSIIPYKCKTAVHVYPALWLMQAKERTKLLSKFWEWKFCIWQLDHKNHENYIPWTFVCIWYHNIITTLQLSAHASKPLKCSSEYQILS